MTPEEFRAIMQNRLIKCEFILSKKSEDYSRNQDKLYNFKRAAGITGETPAQALVGMWLKHVVSVIDIVEDAAVGKTISRERIDEKFTDALNYLLLLEGILEEDMPPKELDGGFA